MMRTIHLPADCSFTNPIHHLCFVLFQVAQEKVHADLTKDASLIKELTSRIDDLKGDVKEEVGKVHMTVGVAEAAALRAERAVHSGGAQVTDIHFARGACVGFSPTLFLRLHLLRPHPPSLH